MSNIFSIDCSSLDCTNTPLGAADVMPIDCLQNVSQSEIDLIIVWNPELGSAPSNWGDSMQVSDFNIDNSDATDVAQKLFRGVGDKPNNEQTSAPVNNFNEVILNTTQSINFEISDVGDLTYDYWRRVQCGKIKPIFLFKTVGGYLYGGANGIAPIKYEVNFPKASGRESLEKISMVITFESIVDPDRVPSPIV